MPVRSSSSSVLKWADADQVEGSPKPGRPSSSKHVSEDGSEPSYAGHRNA